jgi:hypothetical protein
MIDEIFWILCQVLFSATLLFNFIFLKRWKKQSKLECCIFCIFFILILQINSTTSILFYKIRESIMESISVSVNEVADFYYFLNFNYCILTLFLAIVLLLDALVKSEFRNKLFNVSFVAIGISTLINMIKFLSMGNQIFSTVFLIMATYIIYCLTFLVFLSNYMEHKNVRKKMQVLLFTAISLLIFLEVFILINRWDWRNALYCSGITLLMLVYTATNYCKLRKGEIIK